MNGRFQGEERNGVALKWLDRVVRAHFVQVRI